MDDTQEIPEDDDTEKARQGKRLAKAKDRIEELEEAIAETLFSLDHSDMGSARDTLRAALGEVEREVRSRQELEAEIGQMRSKLQVCHRVLDNIHRVTAETTVRQDAIQGKAEIQEVLESSELPLAEDGDHE
jgi:chromosome segregation ATPase